MAKVVKQCGGNFIYFLTLTADFPIHEIIFSRLNNVNLSPTPPNSLSFNTLTDCIIQVIMGNLIEIINNIVEIYGNIYKSYISFTSD